MSESLYDKVDREVRHVQEVLTTVSLLSIAINLLVSYQHIFHFMFLSVSQRGQKIASVILGK